MSGKPERDEFSLILAEEEPLLFQEIVEEIAAGTRVPREAMLLKTLKGNRTWLKGTTVYIDQAERMGQIWYCHIAGSDAWVYANTLAIGQ